MNLILNEHYKNITKYKNREKKAHREYKTHLIELKKNCSISFRCDKYWNKLSLKKIFDDLSFGKKIRLISKKVNLTVLTNLQNSLNEECLQYYYTKLDYLFNFLQSEFEKNLIRIKNVEEMIYLYSDIYPNDDYDHYNFNSYIFDLNSQVSDNIFLYYHRKDLTWNLSLKSFLPDDSFFRRFNQLGIHDYNLTAVKTLDKKDYYFVFQNQSGFKIYSKSEKEVLFKDLSDNNLELNLDYTSFMNLGKVSRKIYSNQNFNFNEYFEDQIELPLGDTIRNVTSWITGGEKDSKEEVIHTKISSSDNKDKLELEGGINQENKLAIASRGQSFNSHLGFKIARFEEQNVLIILEIFPDSRVAKDSKSTKLRTDKCLVKYIHPFIENEEECESYEIDTSKNLSTANACMWKEVKDFIYHLGETIIIPNFDPDLGKVCRAGIHYCLTVDELSNNYLKGKILNPSAVPLAIEGLLDQVIPPAISNKRKKTGLVNRKERRLNEELEEEKIKEMKELKEEKKIEEMKEEKMEIEELKEEKKIEELKELKEKVDFSVPENQPEGDWFSNEEKAEII